MVDRIGMHRANHRQIINVLGEMRKERSFPCRSGRIFKRKLRPQTGELLVLQLRDRLPWVYDAGIGWPSSFTSSGLFASNVSKCDGPPDMYK